MERVNVLCGQDSVYNGFLVNVCRERKLDKYSVYAVVPVEHVNEIEELLLSCALIERVLKRLESYRLASLFLVVDVDP